MSTVGPLLRQTVKALAAAADVVLRQPAGVVVLAYHQVGGPRPSAVNLDPAVFADQVAWLVEHADVLTLDDAVDRLAAGVLPDPQESEGRVPVVLTFDDGTVDFARTALPVLERHDLPVTLYLATGHVEAGTSFWDDGTVLTWDDLRDAVSTGLVTIGSHTHGHALLDRLAPAEVADELDRSVGLVTDRLGVPCAHFAYPKAVPPSAAADRVVRERFRSAALAGGRRNRFGGTDVHLLARTPVQVGDARWFDRKARGGLLLEGLLRERRTARRSVRAAR